MEPSQTFTRMNRSYIAEGEGIIRVMRPRLPTAAQLLPYLERIDEARIYSNYGPLVVEFEARLAALFGCGVIANTASSGTAALAGAILAAAGRAKPAAPFALIPAYTFTATAAVAEMCGYQPYFVDVDAECWMLEPGLLPAHPMIDKVGIVIPVAPYGRPVPQAPWLSFQAGTGIPVVIDDAAASDRLAAEPAPFLGEIPACLSLHATKALGCGEGGAILTTDEGLAAGILRSLNFGFGSERNSICASINGKMSEYHAAIGLAELDGWSEKLARLGAVATCYRRVMEAGGCTDRMVMMPDISAVYALYRARSETEAERICNNLRVAGIEYRLWYGAGLQSNAYFANCRRDALTETEEFAPRLLGLPMSVDLTPADIERIATAVTDATSSAPADHG